MIAQRKVCALQLDIVAPKHTGLTFERRARGQFSKRQFQRLIESHQLLAGESLFGRQEHPVELLEQLRAIHGTLQQHQIATRTGG